VTLLIVMPDKPKQAASWARHLEKVDPELGVRIWPAAGSPKEVVMALSWRHRPGTFLKYGNLRCIASMGAGADHILNDPDLPPNIVVTRVVDPSMAQSMAEYVVMAVLNHCRHTHAYYRKQGKGEWKPEVPRTPGKLRIGVMGLGHLGMGAAVRLQQMGFSVVGWRRTAARDGPVRTFCGGEGLRSFLAASHVLICLLPLTPETRGILDRELFKRLPAGAYVINVARGEHLVEEDLLEALDSDGLSGACLDVFSREPLPIGHPFWTHPRIVVTPHVSSLTPPDRVAPQIVDNYHRLRQGRPLLHTVDPKRGY